MGIPLTTSTPATEAELLDNVSLLGRKNELRQLIKLLTLCRTGQGKGVLVSGNEGIGKSAVLETFIDLAEQHYGSCVVRINWPQQITAQTFFAQIVAQIMSLANGVIQDALHEANKVLHPLGLNWNQGDLVRTVALLRLQESMSGTQRAALAEEQLTQTIYSAIPFFKRLNPAIKSDIATLSKVLLNPWVTLSVSLANPINPHVQQAVQLVERIAGNLQNTARQLSGGQAFQSPMLTDSLMTPAITSPEVVDLSPASSDDDISEESESLTDDPNLVSVQDVQAALINLLVFINSAIRGQQSAFILVVDQWEMLLEATEPVRNDIRGMMSEVLRQTVEQRDFRLLVMLASRCEQESYVLGGSLYNALRTKYLIPPISGGVLQKHLKEYFKEIGVQPDDRTIQEIIRLCQGNPAWMKLIMNMIETDMIQNGLHILDWDTYQERYAVSHPQDLIDLLFTRLQLGFVGEETVFLKTIGRLIGRFQAGTFSRMEAQNALSGIQQAGGIISRLLDGLQQQYFLQPDGRLPGEGRFRFTGPFMLTYLKQKSQPLQEDIPAADKIASLRKVLPLSIKSGELTREKTQEFLSMASTLDNPELTEFVETTLIDAVHQPDATAAIKLSLIESMGLLSSPPVIESMLGMLDEEDAKIREASCKQLSGYLGRVGLPYPKPVIIQAVLKLTGDEDNGVRKQAFQCLAQSSGEDSAVVPALIEALEDEANIAIQQLCLDGLAIRKVKSAPLLNRLAGMLEKTRDTALFKSIVRVLQNYEKADVIPILEGYLDGHARNNQWAEVLMLLFQMDLRAALPFISSFLFMPDQNIDVKLSIIKRLGSRQNPDVEKILISILKESVHQPIPPELRWMTIRSLGWIGQTREALQALENQRFLCHNDDILNQTLTSAFRQISERMPTNGHNGASESSQPISTGQYLPVRLNPIEVAEVELVEETESGEETGDAQPSDKKADYIDLIAVSNDN